MKGQKYNGQSERFLREVNQLLQMNKEELVQNIESDLTRHRVQWDILSDIIRTFARNVRIDSSNIQHLPLNLGNSVSQSYISDIHQGLCKDGLLCAKIDDLSYQTLETQIDYINKAIWNLDAFERFRFRVSSLATAVLIIKIGVKEFCGCFDPSKES